MRMSRHLGLLLNKKPIILYENGTEYHGGLQAYAYAASTSGATRLAPTLTKGASSFTAKIIKSNRAGSVFVNNAVNMTGKAKLSITVSALAVSDYIYMLATSTKADKYASAGSVKITGTGIWNLDVSKLAGNYYVALFIGGSGSQSITVTDWRLS